VENIPYYNFVKSVCRGPFPVVVIIWSIYSA